MIEKRTVAILGCGPAGLLAALAAEQCGFDVAIFSDKTKSKIHGAQVLHVPIPGLTAKTPDNSVKIIKSGTREEYAFKVYGSRDAPVSWDLYNEPMLPVWSMREAYDVLWTAFESSIRDVHMDKSIAERICRGFDRVVSSVPLPVLAPEATYSWQNVWVVSETAHGVTDQDRIIWSGTPSVPWYRASILFNHFDREYSKPIRNAVKILKPLGNAGTCEAFPQMLRVGRYGEYRKGVLIHDAYDNTKEYLTK